MAGTSSETLTLEQWHRAIGMAEAAKLMRGRGGKPPDRSTLKQYADPDAGYRPMGYDGPPVVLRAIRHGQELVTLPEWVEEFMLRQIEVGTPRPKVKVQHETNRGRRSSAKRAQKYLEQQGVL